MKNLKKALALVLIVVMAFSLVTLASAKTNFSDDKDISYNTAVGVMTGIGAISGYVDGSFAPKGFVSRAEAAKMVTYAVLGPTVAASLKTSTTSFSDVPASHWASAYIEWAASKGILNGVGDGSFNPNGNVTAFQLAKMMLCAAGYGKNNEYVGPNWSINVATDGMKYNVFNGNESANFAAPATREEAALYIFNGITKVHQVDYNELFGYYGKGYSVTSGTEGKTIAQATYHMSNVDGIVLGGSITSPTATGTNVSVATISDQTGRVTKLDATATNYKFNATAADMGQMVSIFVNDDSGKVYYTETVSKSVTVFAPVSTPTGYNNAFGSLTFAPATAVYTFDANYTGNNLATGTDGAAATITNLTVGSAAPTGTYATFGGQIVSYAKTPVTTFDKVTAISTTTGAESISFTNLTTKSNRANNDEIAEYQGIAVGDYVTIKQLGSKYSVEKVSTVSGTISQIRNFGIFGEWYITLDGKEYSKSGASDSTSTAQSPKWLDLVNTYPSATDFSKNTYTLYLDANGNWIACTLKSGANASSIVYVTGDSWTASSDYGQVNKVQAVNAAGEQVTYTLASAHTGTGFYKVDINSSTGIASLTSVSSDTNFTMSGDVAHIKASDVLNKANTYYGDNVKFIFVSGSGATLKITTVTGLAAVADIALSSTDDGLFLNPGAGTNRSINTVMVTRPFTGATTAPTVYVDNDATKDSYNGTTSTYYVYIDGVLTKITAKDASLADVDGSSTSVVGKFASYTVDANNVYDLTGVSPATNVHAQQTIAKNGLYNNYFTVGSTTYNATGAKVVDLSQAPGEPLLYTSVASLAAATASKSFTVSFVTNTAGVVTTIYVEAAAN